MSALLIKTEDFLYWPFYPGIPLYPPPGLKLHNQRTLLHTPLARPMLILSSSSPQKTAALNFALKAGLSFNHLGFLSIDEGYFKQDQFIATKRWNGDEQKVSLSGQQLSVLKVRLYRI